MAMLLIYFRAGDLMKIGQGYLGDLYEVGRMMLKRKSHLDKVRVVFLEGRNLGQVMDDDIGVGRVSGQEVLMVGFGWIKLPKRLDHCGQWG